MPQLEKQKSYEEKVLKSILAEFEEWIGYTQKTKATIELNIRFLHISDHWHSVPMELQEVLINSVAWSEVFLKKLEYLQHNSISGKLEKDDMLLVSELRRKAFKFEKDFSKKMQNTKIDNENSQNMQVINLLNQGKSYFNEFQDASIKFENSIRTLDLVISDNEVHSRIFFKRKKW